jgi:hypothetical protein
MAEPTIYDLLSKKDISEITTAQFNQAAKVTAVDRRTVEFWSGIITLSQVLNKSRTYSHGLPIPELSAIEANTIANGATAEIKPTGTEIWRVENITNTADMTVALSDGTSTQTLMTGTSPKQFGNLFLTNTLYIVVANASGDNADNLIAYHKVGL